MPLNTTRLSILREVASRGTITAAAKALYLTPPAVSHQLAVLEREVGVPLLQRTARSIQLTGAGRRLVEHADTILAECEVALADVESFAAEVSGTVRLSAFQTAAQSIALPAMVALRSRYPRLEVIANDLEPTVAIPALKSAQLDIALSHEWDYVPLPKEPALDRFGLLAEPIYALLPAGTRSPVDPFTWPTSPTRTGASPRSRPPAVAPSTASPALPASSPTWCSRATTSAPSAPPSRPAWGWASRHR